MDGEKFEKVVGAPAVALESTIETSRGLAKKLKNQKQVKQANKFWRSLGPGLTTGAADDDPSGIATYSQAGAQYGFQLLWTSIFTLPFMALVQEMCARLGIVTGRGLAANMRKYYPRWVLYLSTFFLFIANTFNIGADLGAMAKATQLIFPEVQFAHLLIGFTVVMLLLQIFVSYEKYAQYLKYLALILGAYVVSGLMVGLDWQAILSFGLVPSIEFSKEQIMLICAIFGTTISPYLFFWQTSQEVEEGRIDRKSSDGAPREVHRGDMRKMRLDVVSGMFVSNLVMFFIIATCAATLYANGIKNITSAAEAAAALRPFAGQNAYYLFTFGIIGTGMLAIPILAGSASYALSESFKWKFGLNRKLKQASAFYGAIIISMCVGLLMNFVGVDPIKALIYSAILNGLIAPIILVQIVMMSSNEKIMGKWVNSPFVTFCGWVITFVMVVVGVAAIAVLLL